jgi:Uma2 family endonuclease
MATNIHPLMTIADWEAMPDDGNRYEIIEGELFASSSPGLTHQIALKHGVPEYWIVDPVKHVLEIYRLKNQCFVLERILGNDEALTSHELPGFQCQVSEIFKQ